MWDWEEEVLHSSLGSLFKSKIMLECSLLTKFGSTFERGEHDGIFWELRNLVLRDIDGSTLIEVELVSTCWEEGVGSLGEGETRGIWAVGKKSLLEEVTKLNKNGKDQCKDI